jgi:hypothetical protein
MMLDWLHFVPDDQAPSKRIQEALLVAASELKFVEVPQEDGPGILSQFGMLAVRIDVFGGLVVAERWSFLQTSLRGK